MKSYRLQANISRWLADLARRAAHIETRSMSSYVTSLIVADLKAKGLLDKHGRPTERPPNPERWLGVSRHLEDGH